MMQDVDAFGVRLHESVLDGVMDHLHEVARATRSTMQVAQLSAGRFTRPTWRARDAVRLLKTRRQGPKDRLQPLYRGRRAADHQAVAALEAEDAATGADVEVCDASAVERS